MYFKYNSKAQSYEYYIQNMKPFSKGSLFVTHSENNQLFGTIFMYEKYKNDIDQIKLTFPYEAMLKFLIKYNFDMVEIYKHSKGLKENINKGFFALHSPSEIHISLSMSKFLKQLLEKCNDQELLEKLYNSVPEYLV
jgi:hypothetical protein